MSGQKASDNSLARYQFIRAATIRMAAFYTPLLPDSECALKVLENRENTCVLGPPKKPIEGQKHLAKPLGTSHNFTIKIKNCEGLFAWM